MRRFKKQIVFLFGCIALISYLSFHFAKEDTIVSVISTQEEGNHMQIYLKDEDATLVPLSVAVDEESGEEEKIALMFSYLSGKQNIKGFLPLFEKECIPDKVEIKDHIVSLYLNDSFKQYNEKDELKVLEAITWGATQFSNTSQVKLFLNKEQIKQMPIAATPIPETLTRTIGINHFESASFDLHDSTSLVVYGTKKIYGQEYLVPKSRRIQVEGDLLTSNVEAIVSDISVSTMLSQPLYIDNIQVVDYKMENGVLIVDLNKNILASDASVKQNVYDALVLSLAAMEGIESIEIKVDGNVVAPQSLGSEAVSKYEFLYNQVQF